MTAASPTILVVDDQQALREELCFSLGYHGFATAEAKDGVAGLQAALQPEVAAVLLDIKMPGMDGLEVLARIKEQRPELPVVMISGHGDVETAVLAVKKGAYDFLQKPFGSDRVLVSVKNALKSADLQRENAALRAERDDSSQLLGRSDAMAAVRTLIDKAAPTDV